MVIMRHPRTSGPRRPPQKPGPRHPFPRARQRYRSSETARATHRPDGRHLIIGAALAYAQLWLLLRDASVSLQAQVGELLGAEAVLALTVSALLAGGSSRADELFGGPRNLQRWHQGSAVAGLALILTHLVVVVGGPENKVGNALGVLSVFLLLSLMALALLTPRGRVGRWRGPLGWTARMPYDRWKAVHRLTAVSLLAGMAHGFLNSSAFAHQPALALIYLGVCALGTAALGYRLILRRRLLRGAPYQVARVEPVAAGIRTITLRPEGTAWTPAPGQFVEVRFAGVKHGAHPFTVVGSRPDGRIQIAVKASGNDTRALHRTVSPSGRAWVHRPRGDFDHRRAGRRQIWVAGGIGITPFLSWIRSLAADHDHVVDLWYSVRNVEDAAFLDELTAASARSPWLNLHLVVSSTDGRLTARRVLAESAAGAHASAFVCGPPAMVDTLTRDLTSMGLAGPVFHEAFSTR